MTLLRRSLLLGLVASTSLLISCASLYGGSQPPVLFVHGNGDSAAQWTTTVWRFESNGWPRERLLAIDLTYPLARDTDTTPQPGRSSATEQMNQLSAEVDKLLKATGASRVVLMGNSRGGNAIRNYIANGGGAEKVSYAILGGTPNHGVQANPDNNPGNEFNGAGPFLRGLNTPKGASGDEVTPGVKWMTIRSDNNDKYAQPDGAWLGFRGKPTNVSFDGPALKGAENVVIAGIDHRETAFGPQAFAQAYRFITGKLPPTSSITPEAEVVLDGLVSGLGVNNVQGGAPSNLPLVGAIVEVYATNAATGERQGTAVLHKAIAADGRWGPLKVDGKSSYEFVVSAPGYAVTHVYRSPFPRSSRYVNLLAGRLSDADKDAKSLVAMSRPRGYFGLPRDQVSFDGKSPPPGLVPGVAGVSTLKVKPTDINRSVVGEFNGERIAGWAWPVSENHMVFLELHQ